MNGDTLSGRALGPYRITALIGSGGMAHVYRAVHTQLERQVALKVLRRDLALGTEFPDRFRREAQAIARLRHPHIVQIFDFDSTSAPPYIVMELLEGDSLRTLLSDSAARGDRLPADEAVRIALDALDGLAAAHAAGIIHRDLKPGNILFTREGRAVLTDFGIALVSGDAGHTATGALMGTLIYMAPEQGLRGEAGVASDVYALGIILYELLTGRVPFEGDTPLGTLMKHVNEPLPDPRSLNPTLPAPLVAVLERALAKTPADRFESAEAMGAALSASAQAAGLAVADRVAIPAATIAAVVSGDGRHALAGLAEAEAATETPLARSIARDASPSRTGSAVFVGLAVFFLANMMAIGLSGMQGRLVEVFAAGWPFEILWLGFFLSLLARALRSTGFLTPIILSLALGLPASYLAVTGRWHEWWWWVFAFAAAPTAIITAYRQARRDPPRSHDRLNSAIVVFTGLCAALSLIVAFF